jgi:hypothetical protein
MALKPKQIKLIEAIIANPQAPHTELAEIVGINRNTITVWKRSEEFKAALKERLQEIWQDSEVIAVDTMRNLAKDGDFKAAKYILDSLGYAPVQKIEADLHTDIQINIEE